MQYAIGPTDARLMVLGDEAEYEDTLTGKPFSSMPGSFLQRVLRELDIPARLVYVVRTGDADQDAALLAQEVATMPALKILVPVGKVARRMLGVKGKVLSIAGIRRDITFNGRKYGVIPLASPKYVLSTPAYAYEWQSGWGVVQQAVTGDADAWLHKMGRVYIGQWA